MASKTILVIDDSPTILKVMDLALSRNGHTVLTAFSGGDALALAREHHPDLYLIDFFLPDMDGFNLCRALRADVNLPAAPIIIMSARGKEVGRRFAYTADVHSVISKPFSPETVVELIEKAMSGTAVNGHGPLFVESAVNGTDNGRSALATTHSEETVRTVSEREAQNVKELSSAVARQALKHGVRLSSDLLGSCLREALAATDLQLAQRRGQRAGAATILRGDLELVSLPDVLLLLQHQRQTGLLVVRRAEEEVKIYFRSGRIERVQAPGFPEELRLGRFIVERGAMTEEQLQGHFAQHRIPGGQVLGARLLAEGLISTDDLRWALSRQSCERIYEVLRWSAGTFLFVDGFADGEAEMTFAQPALSIPVDLVLLEGVRRVDEWHLIEREVESLDDVYICNEDALGRMERGRLTGEEWGLLKLINGKNTLKDIVRATRKGSFEVSRLVYRLAAARLVRKRVQALAV